MCCHSKDKDYSHMDDTNDADDAGNQNTLIVCNVYICPWFSGNDCCIHNKCIINTVFNAVYKPASGCIHNIKHVFEKCCNTEIDPDYHHACRDPVEKVRGKLLGKRFEHETATRRFDVLGDPQNIRNIPYGLKIEINGKTYTVTSAKYKCCNQISPAEAHEIITRLREERLHHKTHGVIRYPDVCYMCNRS